MADAALNPFIHALITKVVPVAILAGAGGLLLRELLQWFERKATREVRSRRNAKKSETTHDVTSTEVDTIDVPRCPWCDSPMVKRKTHRRAHAGEESWVCPNFPKCCSARAI